MHYFLRVGGSKEPAKWTAIDEELRDTEKCYVEEQDANNVSSDISGVKTADMSYYIESELADLAKDLEVYNVLPCPPGCI